MGYCKHEIENIPGIIFGHIIGCDFLTCFSPSEWRRLTTAAPFFNQQTSVHKPGVKTSEFAVVTAFLIASSFLLWRHGAVIADGIKGMGYSASAYALSRAHLKRKTATCATEAAPTIDVKAISVEAAKLIDTRAIAVQALTIARAAQAKSKEVSQ